jgi:hypothetical protein
MVDAWFDVITVWLSACRSLAQHTLTAPELLATGPRTAAGPNPSSNGSGPVGEGSAARAMAAEHQAMSAD